MRSPLVHYVKAHPFHLVESSPYPILVSLSLFFLVSILGLEFSDLARSADSSHGFTLAALMGVGSILCWVNDISRESNDLGLHTREVSSGLNLGFVLFVLSEAALFGSVFWAFFHSSLSPTPQIGALWPPVGISPISPMDLPLLNTVVLLSSSCSVTYAHHSLTGSHRQGCLIGLGLTVALAFFFTLLQHMEYVHAPFSLTDSIYGTLFFSATGLHGLHIVFGSMMLVAALLRLLAYRGTAFNHLGLKSSILYWHFIDGLWALIYVIIY